MSEMRYTLALIILILLAPLFMSVAGLAFRLLRWLVTMVAIACASVLLGSVVGLIAGSVCDDDSYLPAAGGVAIALLVGGGLSAWRKSRGLPVPSSLSVRTRPPREELPTDRLESAWDTASGLLSPALVRPIRTQCDTLLRMSDADPLDVALLDWATFIRFRIPEMIVTVEQLCRNAVPADRRTLLDDLVRDLTSVGVDVQHRMEARQRAAQDHLATLRRHLAARTGTVAELT